MLEEGRREMAKAAEMAKEKGQEAWDAARKQSRQAWEEVRATGLNALDDVRDKGDEIWDDTEKLVKKHPARTIGLTLLVGVVIGGLASIPGALLGAAFIQFVPNIADQLSKAVPWAIYGMFMLAVMYFMPTGMAGFLRAGWTRVTLSFDIKTRRK
jgi:ElaB/YqjD/DUF883 family membrane-anchored ribosome-binding protein